MSQRTLKPRTIFCQDNLPILRGINSDSIDLIYLDPPFNKGRAFHAPIGTSAAGAEFRDIWSPDDVKDEWHNQINDRFPELYKYLDAVGAIGSRSAKYYLIYMAVRMMEMHRILKNTGSLYLHCDPTASHYLKLLLDTIFGHAQFRNEIIWSYQRWTGATKHFQRMHDTILFYTGSENWSFNQLVEAYSEKSKHKSKRHTTFEDDGQMSQVYTTDTRREKAMRDVWAISYLNSQAKERTGYPTQKPLALLERIVEASSNPEDMVLDPFCGCATTCIAAERLSRQWIGIDVSAKAYDLVKMRLHNEVPADWFRGEPIFRDDIPTRTDQGTRAPTKNDKQLLYGMQDGKCKGCRTNFSILHLEIEHIIPQAQGGGHEFENLQLLCGHCNRVKGDRPMEYLSARLKALSQNVSGLVR